MEARDFVCEFAELMKPQRDEDNDAEPSLSVLVGSQVKGSAADDGTGRDTEVAPSMDPRDEQVIRHWSAENAVDIHVRAALKDIPALYEDDYLPAAKQLQETIIAHQRARTRVDRQLQREVNYRDASYGRRQRRILEEMLDICDAADEPVVVCDQARQVLSRCRASVARSVRLLALHRRRNNMIDLQRAVADVASWNTKLETVVSKLQERDYVAAVITLGARLYSDTGSPLVSRERMLQNSVDHAPQPANVAGTAGASVAHRRDGALMGGIDQPTTAAPATPPQPSKPAGRQRSQTLAYMAHSHGGGMRPPAAAVNTAGGGSPNKRSGSPSATRRQSAVDDKERRLQEFVEAVGGPASETVVGRVALSRWFELKENGTDLVVYAMKSEIHTLLTTQFSLKRFFSVLDGLYALHVRRDSISRFFLDCIDPIISRAMHEALQDVVGEDSGETWEDIAVTLIPSEFHGCTVQVLAKLCTVLRTIFQFQRQCKALEEGASRPRDAQPATAFGEGAGGVVDSGGSPARGGSPTSSTVSEKFQSQDEVVLAACRFLNTVGNQTLQKCLASVVLYSMQTRLGRGQLDDALHVFWLLQCFVKVCAGTCTDGAAISTQGSLNFQLQRLLRDEFVTRMMESTVKVMQDDTCFPFPASSQDFRPLYAYIPSRAVAEDAKLFSDYLLLEPLPPMTREAALAQADVIHAASEGGVINPFFTSAVNLDATPAAPSDTIPLDLFEGHPIFTFSSFMVCKQMIELASAVVHLPSAATDLLRSASYLACVYFWFVLTNFVAASETIPFDQDVSVPQHIRDFSKLIKDATELVHPTGGFPLFPGCICHNWRARAGVSQSMFSAQERITMIASLTGVLTCHRLVVCALTPLLPQDVLTPVASTSEALANVARYAISRGIQKVAANVFPSEPVAVALERGLPSLTVTAPDGALCPLLRGLVEQVSAIHLRLKDMHRDLPFLAAQRLLEHIVFNLCLGVVDGISRLRKVSDAAKNIITQEVTTMLQLLRTLHPSIPERLFAYVASYVKVFFAPFPEALAFIQNSHTLYTAKQLISLGDKEGFMKKREAEQAVSRANHEDKLPLFLIEN